MQDTRQFQTVHKGHLDIGDNQIHMVGFYKFQGAVPILESAFDTKRQGHGINFLHQIFQNKKFVLRDHYIILFSISCF